MLAKKRGFFSVILVAACAGTSREPDPAIAPAAIYEVVNRSACTARIVLYDPEGKVIENIKYEDLRAGRSERYRLPTPGMKLAAVAIDALGNACSLTESHKIQVTKLQ